MHSCVAVLTICFLFLGSDVHGLSNRRAEGASEAATLRELLQIEGCGLSADLQEEFYDTETQTWRAADRLVTEIGGDWQQLVDCAPENGTVSISAEDVLQPDSTIAITRAIRIRSDSRNAVFTCPEGDQSLFSVQDALDVVFEGLVIQDCRSRSVSPIEIESSSVLVTGCVFNGNQARSGGAIFAHSDSSLQIEDSQFTRNTAVVEGGCVFANESVSLDISGSTFARGQSPLGGCIAAATLSTMNITTSTVRRCNGGESGGGIYADNVQWLDVRTSDFVENVCTVRGGGIDIFSHPSEIEFPILVTRSVLYVENSTFRRNHALRGGGILLGHRVIGEINDCDFIGNQAQGDDAHAGGILVEGFEHGLYLEDDAFDEEGLDALHRMIEDVMIPEEDVDEAAPPTAILHIERVRMIENNGSNYCGGLEMSDGSLVWARDCLFEGNHAHWMGGVYNMLSTFNARGLRFINNAADVAAGAFGVLGRPFTDQVGTAGFAESALRDAEFVNNTAGDYGGAVLVDGQDAFLFLHSNISFRQNSAREGGAISFELGRLLVIEDTVFDSNNAALGGGAIASQFQQYLQMHIVGHDIIFRNNSALSGGALLADYNVHFADRGAPTIQFEESISNAVLNLTSVSFQGNFAGHGGAIELTATPASFSNLTMEDNLADDEGGAIFIEEGSIARIIDGRFQRNHARRGGSAFIDEAAVLHCIRCEINNSMAYDFGGAVDVFAHIYTNISHSFQCDECVLSGNSATFGGAIHMDYLEDTEAVLVALLETTIINNYASIGGGALFVAYPRSVAYRADFDLEIEDEDSLSAGMLTFEETHALPELYPDDWPESWTNNTVADNGYGARIASYAETGHLFAGWGDQPVTEIAHQDSGRELPHLRLVMRDIFGQGPAEMAMNTTVALASDNEGNLSGQVDSEIVRGETHLTHTILRGRPDDYNLNLTFGEDHIEHIDLPVHLRECIIGEEAQDNETLCVPCNFGSYNFEVMSPACQICPDNGVCDGTWGIAPERDYWLAHPCDTSPRECLVEHACEYEHRAQRLLQFFQDHEPYCNTTVEALIEYQDLECHTGYRGYLCGSCEEGYGRRGYECRECLEDAISWFILFLMFVWFICLAVVSIKGNLPIRRRRRRRTMKRRPTEMRRSSTVPLGAPNMRDIEMAEVYGASPQASMPNSPASPSRQVSCIKSIDETRRRLAEAVKIAVNYAQVTGMALTVNVDWTTSLSDFLAFIDVLGAMSVGSVVSLDCMVDTDSSTPRTIISTVLVVLSPLFLIIFVSGGWLLYLWRHKRLSLWKRRLLLAVFAVIYISYMGICRRLIRVLYCVQIQDNVRTQYYWTEDTSVECYSGSHGVLVGVLVVPALVLLIAFPIWVGLYLTAKRRSGDLGSDNVKETLGFMFAAYREEVVYWDTLVISRKALIALIVVFSYPLGGNLQGLIVVFILAIALMLHLVVFPYRELYNNLNAFEGFSLLSSTATYFAGLFLNDSHTSSPVEVAITIGVILINLSFIIIVLVYIAQALFDVIKNSLMENPELLNEDIQDMPWKRIIRLFIEYEIPRVWGR